MSRKTSGRKEKRKESKGAPRLSLGAYGIDRERYVALRAGCRGGLYGRETLRAACGGSLEFLAEWIVLSVTGNLSYDDLGILCARGEIKRPPCGRTDFYGYRRRFYSNLNMMLKEKGEG